MTPALRHELRQRKPFTSLCQEAFLNISRTETVLVDAMERVLKPHGLAMTQYNVLRMLRGAGDEGLCRNEIRDRLISRMPDVTRLLDRMEVSGLVSRVRSDEDRRLVRTTLTRRGRALVDRLDAEVDAEHARQLGHLTREQLQTLIELLTIARAQA
ncbi:MAG: MarR family transcriptional regulator [Gemmatimonadaceae bacterium]